MIKRHSFVLTLAAIFLLLSGVTYLIHYLIFRDVHHIVIYLVGDLAFLPIEVFLVVIVIERILSRREKQITLQKLNMVMGAFSVKWDPNFWAIFSAASTALIAFAIALPFPRTGHQATLGMQ
jgi:hypothetical protein